MRMKFHYQILDKHFGEKKITITNWQNIQKQLQLFISLNWFRFIIGNNIFSIRYKMFGVIKEFFLTNVVLRWGNNFLDGISNQMKGETKISIFDILRSHFAVTSLWYFFISWFLSLWWIFRHLYRNSQRELCTSLILLLM